MLRKRFDYAKSVADGTNPRTSSVRASLGKSVAGDLADAARLFECCSHSVRRNAALGTLFQGIANGNNRLLLQYVRQVLKSGNLNTAKILDLFAEGGYTLAEHEVARALMFGNDVHYDPNACRFANLFDIARADPRDHFIRVIVLEFMNRHLEGSQHHGFCSIESIVLHACAAGFSRDQALDALRFLYAQEYCEGVVFDAEWDDAGGALRLRDRGRYHITRLVKSFVYLDAVVVDTPICDADTRKQIRDVDLIQDRLARARAFLAYLERSSRLVGATDFTALWGDIHAAIANDIEDIRSRLAETALE